MIINLNLFKNYCEKVKPLILNVIYSKRKPFVRSPTLFQEITPHFLNNSGGMVAEVVLKTLISQVKTPKKLVDYPVY